MKKTYLINISCEAEKYSNFKTSLESLDFINIEEISSEKNLFKKDFYHQNCQIIIFAYESSIEALELSKNFKKHLNLNLQVIVILNSNNSQDSNIFGLEGISTASINNFKETILSIIPKNQKTSKNIFSFINISSRELYSSYIQLAFAKYLSLKNITSLLIELCSFEYIHKNLSINKTSSLHSDKYFKTLTSKNIEDKYFHKLNTKLNSYLIKNPINPSDRLDFDKDNNHNFDELINNSQNQEQYLLINLGRDYDSELSKYFYKHSDTLFIVIDGDIANTHQDFKHKFKEKFGLECKFILVESDYPNSNVQNELCISKPEQSFYEYFCKSKLSKENPYKQVLDSIYQDLVKKDKELFVDAGS